MSWSLQHVLALSFAGRLTSAAIRDLVTAHDGLEEALEAIGRHPMDIMEQADKQLHRCASLGVDVITFSDPRYPHRLLTIDRYPAILFIRGSLPPESAPSIAVVGTRACTVHYGKPVTDMFVEEWTHRGCVIVSGLANGIDFLAHEAALRHHGQTIAVIASGIDRITPIPANNLSDRIVAEGGCIISEHACGIAAQPPYFPARNRIISGLSDAVIVIESKIKGGALITADFAQKQRRPLFAVPGPITSTRSEGCHALIRSGAAQCLVKAEDLASVVAFDRVDQFPQQSEPIPGLDDGEQHLVDTIAERWQCTISEALSRLLALEMEGRVQQLPGGRFVARR